ncbi:MAG: alcohol dehydrogenase [Alphaproteobacteria bacterium]|jgi:aryl-alcohol dehydrogenase-like predicted oxidoreductase|nr:alcohol dehydrogenase [Alphaproteobacteria bacterium]
MKKRTLGHSGLSVAPLCFGGNVFGWTANEKTSFDILDAFTGAGFDFVDTADVYTRWIEGNKGGESETIIGNWFARSGKRKNVVLATKCGMDMGPDGKGLSKAHILKSVEGSLKRLKTDYIDLYQSHADDEAVPQEETLAAYDTLVKSGKVRAIGASNFTAARLDSAVAVAKKNGLPVYTSLQPEYNLYDREKFEAELAGVCEKHGIGVISYYSLARGFLSGKYRSEADLGKSPRGGSVQKNYFNDRGWRILKALDDVAVELSANQTQVAIAWLIAQPLVTAPIASATSVVQLEDLMKAARLDLTAEALSKLNKASAWKGDVASAA